MCYRLCTFLESANFAYARNVTAIPLDPEFHVLVGIEATRIHRKLRCSHDVFSSVFLSLGFDLPGHLLQVQDHEFSGLEWCESNPDVHDAQIAIVLSCRFRIALHEISISGFLSLERTLTEEVVHKRSDVEPDLRVQRFVVRFKHNPLQTAV